MDGKSEYAGQMSDRPAHFFFQRMKERKVPNRQRERECDGGEERRRRRVNVERGSGCGARAQIAFNSGRLRSRFLLFFSSVLSLAGIICTWARNHFQTHAVSARGFCIYCRCPQPHTMPHSSARHSRAWDILHSSVFPPTLLPLAHYFSGGWSLMPMPGTLSRYHHLFSVVLRQQTSPWADPQSPLRVLGPLVVAARPGIGPEQPPGSGTGSCGFEFTEAVL